MKDTLDTKSELLEPKKEKSPTCSNFEIFDHDPHLDMNFETHNNVVYNFWVYIYVGI